MASCIPGKDANKAVMREKSNATFNGGSDNEEDIIMPVNPALLNQKYEIRRIDPRCEKKKLYLKAHKLKYTCAQRAVALVVCSVRNCCISVFL